MVQAATEGAIDFTQADPQDNWWWRRTSWILSDLLRKRNLTYLQNIVGVNLAYLSSIRANHPSFGDLQQRVADGTESIQGMLFPWLSKEEQLGQSEIDQLVQQWRDAFGDPNDPDVKAGIGQLVEAINRPDQAEEEWNF